ncbi:YeeE/YedE family protein [Luteibacter aegosomatis]|uniref:YeeE/YedE family protein n=1 Tax=Luteibacter aegosomatis TaxID=2911537 RepID=UPI001FF79F8A|nr:YeeE/YedE family protein [Luteibacter aegosomatis]UPG83898.1 YeeE/YedE family protein [Luteibacter aegosomatis]
MSGYGHPLLGGMLLGVASMLLLLLNGRIAGISGIVGRLLQGQRFLENAAFVMGLSAGPIAYAAIFGAFPVITITASWPVLIVAGLLVGVGTRMGAGCTSGHGIVGVARFSRRSIVATAVFLGSGILVATLTGPVR